MARINLKDAYAKSFRKEIQRAYNFLVTFYTNDKEKVDEFEIDLHDTSIVRKIDSEYVKSITLPQYKFDVEVQEMGSFLRSTPKLESSSLPLRLRMELIEDDKHTIGYFVQYLQNKIINEFGIYRGDYYNAERTKLQILVEIFKPNGTKVVDYKYYNCFLLDATEPTFDYNSNEAISYTLNLACDFYSTRYYERGPDIPKPVKSPVQRGPFGPPGFNGSSPNGQVTIGDITIE